jgi:methylmalonyl-CoA carboxyltransferase large subunit
MSSETRDQQALTQAIESLRSEVARLSQRVAAIEGVAGRAPAASPSNANHAFGAPITDEALICVISAALAAYLGVQPRIRQIRLVGGASWAQQGRVTIQASHALSIHHG